MYKKIKSNFLLIEFFLIFLSLFGWILWKKFGSPFMGTDLAIDIVAIVSLLLLLVIKNNSPRHYWYGFILLISTSLLTLVGADTFANISAGISLTFFSLGVLNQLLFKK